MSRIYRPIPEEAFALHPVRIIGGKLREYTAFCAPEGMEPLTWVKSVLNRISICGAGKQYENDNVMFDILNEDGDIIGEYILSKSAFEYAREQLKFKLLN